MSDLALTAKREAVAQAWAYWIRSATGDTPYITRHTNGIDIDWKPGQAEKMQAYLAGAMGGKKDKTDDGSPALNVKVNFTPVLAPLAIKKGWIYAAGFTALGIFLAKMGG